MHDAVRRSGTMTPDIAVSRPEATRRFLAKRNLIIDAASALINEVGVKGLSLAGVGEAIGLGSTSVPYYFRRKEDLAAACFDRALDLLDAQVAEAGAQSGVSARLRRLVALSFEALVDTGRGNARPVVRLSDLRAMEDPIRAALVGRYFAIFRRARACFGNGGDEEEQLRRVMRAHILLENLYNLPIWLRGYAPEEHPRVQSRLVELLEGGMAGAGAAIPPRAPPGLTRDDGADPGERFLDAATRLINERGYRGTSVERIASQLNVTKGSFYHHLGAKDDLVLRCFERSHVTIGRALDAALGWDGSRLEQVGAATSALLTIQLSDRTPLLRTVALPALPPDLLAQVIEQSERIARRFAGMIIDGITEGSMPAVDPLIGGEVLMWSVNAAYELRARAARVPIERAVSLYGSTLFGGLLA